MQCTRKNNNKKDSGTKYILLTDKSRYFRTC